MALVRSAVLLVVAVLLLGCESRPRAPALTDDPVYQNDREGFRFLAPQGWVQGARAEVPPGPLTREQPLVDYRPGVAGQAGSFRVSAIDLPDEAAVASYLAGAAYGVASWKPVNKPESFPVGNATGTLYRFLGTVGKKEELAREVISVQRGKRFYLFTALFSPRDVEKRDQLRKAVESVIWKD